VCSIFLSRLKNGNQPVIFEDGKQLRDYVFVKDVAKSNLLAVKKAELSGVYNIGTGKPADLMDVYSALADILGSSIKPKFTGEFRAGDTRHDFADITKAKKELGFKPDWDLKSGLKQLVEWGETQEAEDKFERAERERREKLGR
jgi:dTDP-L-rhamnose 4-epimerase